jgi:hypothetical protein
MTPLKPPQTIRASLKHSAGRPSPSPSDRHPSSAHFAPHLIVLRTIMISTANHPNPFTRLFLSIQDSFAAPF